MAKKLPKTPKSGSDKLGSGAPVDPNLAYPFLPPRRCRRP
jgi:hypothetical protein